MTISAAELTIENGFVRAMPPGQSTTAAFMTLLNESENDVTIADVSSPIAMHAMLHSNTVEEGVASMQHMDELVIKAQSKQRLMPGGIHIMLMHLQQEPKINDKVSLTLHYADGTTQTVVLQVKKQ